MSSRTRYDRLTLGFYVRDNFLHSLQSRPSSNAISFMSLFDVEIVQLLSRRTCFHFDGLSLCLLTTLLKRSWLTLMKFGEGPLDKEQSTRFEGDHSAS